MKGKLMDARAFGTYLKNLLLGEAKKYEGNLLSANYETITEAKRIGGIRDTLIGIAASIDGALNDFYKNNNHPLPEETSKND